MDPTPGIVSFGDLLAPTGILIAAGAITTLVEIVKAALPAVDRRVSGATMALVLSLGLYVAAALAIPQTTADGYLTIAFAWITCAATAVGIRAGASHVGEVRAGTAGLSAEVRVEDTSLAEDVRPPDGTPGDTP